MAGRACPTMSNAYTMMFPCANTAPTLLGSRHGNSTSLEHNSPAKHCNFTKR
jgi:hypothetical protein